MAELADALDSGSSGHCARAGSSPVIRSIAEETIEKSVVFFYVKLLCKKRRNFDLKKNVFFWEQISKKVLTNSF